MDALGLEGAGAFYGVVCVSVELAVGTSRQPTSADAARVRGETFVQARQLAVIW